MSPKRSQKRPEIHEMHADCASEAHAIFPMPYRPSPHRPGAFLGDRRFDPAHRLAIVASTRTIAGRHYQDRFPVNCPNRFPEPDYAPAEVRGRHRPSYRAFGVEHFEGQSDKGTYGTIDQGVADG